MNQIGRSSTAALAGVLLLTGLAFAADAPAKSPPTKKAAAAPPEAEVLLDPAAEAALVKMGSYVNGLQSFSIHAETMTDEILLTGHKIQSGASSDYTVRRPDRLHAEVAGDDSDMEYIYDGKSLTLYGKRVKYYANVPVPGTLGELFTALREYGLTLPLGDVISGELNQSALDRVLAGIDIGPARVNGVECEQYGFHQEDVDWQVWIQNGDQPLPLKLVITTLTEPTQPQFIATMTWNTSVVFDEAQFTFVPPAGSAKIPLETVAKAGAEKKSKH